MDNITKTVLEFYKTLPFNDTSSAAQAAEEIVTLNAV